MALQFCFANWEQNLELEGVSYCVISNLETKVMYQQPIAIHYQTAIAQHLKFHFHISCHKKWRQIQLKKKFFCTTANWWFWCANNSVTFQFTLRHNRAEGIEAGKTTCMLLVAFLGLGWFRRAEEMKFCKRQHESSHWPPTCENCQLLIQALASWVSPVLSSGCWPLLATSTAKIGGGWDVEGRPWKWVHCRTSCEPMGPSESAVLPLPHLNKGVNNTP